MLYPDRHEFARLCQHGNLVPVYRQVMADLLTPVLALARLGPSSYGFLLESVTGGENIGRYSFLGVDPDLIFRSSGQEAEVGSPLGERRRLPATPHTLELLENFLADMRAVSLPGLPRFSGGAVGYFSYDVVRQIERLPKPPPRSLDLPDIYFGVYRTMLVFDHVNKTCKIVAHADVRQQSPARAYAEAAERIEKTLARLRAPGPLSIEEVRPLPAAEPEVASNFRREDFLAAVARSKEYIRAGDIFQVVLSQRLAMPCQADPFEIYRHLRVINPSPYMFLLFYPEMALVGSSPEVMVRVENRKIVVRPIAGTRRRGQDEAEDEALARELLADPKELAEHAMLVDLARNDVGRVAVYGSVRLTEQMAIERYSHVMHIVSNVEGMLRPELTALAALKACLPAGTVSGAPKVRAMEIIDELEPDQRGPYAGAIGYLDYSGNLDTCIAIRTILLHRGQAYVQAGAGLVADSVPENEYVETRNKAKALLKAIQAATASAPKERA
ncbi:MAG: anthranilate synthase component I [Planctomycetota bacterium]|nr:anthranilate synthase component I [Planctomycetota bacterium]